MKLKSYLILAAVVIAVFGVESRGASVEEISNVDVT